MSAPTERLRRRLRPRWEDLTTLATDVELSVYATKRALRTLEEQELAERRTTPDGRVQWRTPLPDQR